MNMQECYAYIHEYAGMYVYTYTNAHNVYVHINMYICIYVCIYVCVYLAQAAPVVRLLTLAQADATARRRRRAKPAVTRMERPGTTLQATEGPRGGVPWGRSASGRGAQAAPVVHLLILAHAARWRTAAGEQNYV